MKTGNLSLWAFTLTAAALLHGCVSGTQLRAVPARHDEASGTYTLLLYGCRYPEDIKNLAILVDEKSKYPVEIYDIKTSYRVDQGVPAGNALRRAEEFVRCSTHRVSQTQIRRIIDDRGDTIGFEIRPLYFPLEFGIMDVMLVNYELKNGVVNAYIRLDKDVERALESSGFESPDIPN
jgi:hypothetical protein